MKRLVPVLVAFAVAFSCFFFVPAKASAATALPTYTLEDAVSRYRKYEDGSYYVTVGSLDIRSGILPYTVARVFENGSLFLQNSYNDFNLPPDSTLQIGSDYTYTFNVYPLGVEGSANYVVDISGAESGVWSFTYSLSFWEDSLDHAPDGDYFNPSVVRLALFWYDSNYNLLSQSEQVLNDNFTGGSRGLSTGNNLTSDVAVTVPDSAQYMRYALYYGQYGVGMFTDYNYSGQLFVGCTVSFFTYDYTPQNGPIEDILGDYINGVPVPKPPSSKPEFDDLHDAEDGLLQDVLEDFLGIPDYFRDALALIAGYGAELLALSWLFNLFYQIPFVHSIVDLSFSLGLITVIFGVGFSLFSKFARSSDGESGKYGRGKSKGGDG